MRYLFYVLVVVFSLVSCKQGEKKTTLDLQYINTFPAETVISYLDANLIRVVDTLDLKSKEDALLELKIDKPSSVFVKHDNEVQEFFILPKGSLIVKEGNGDALDFEGETSAENNFLQAIDVDKDLKKLIWDYDSELDDFKDQVNAYFDYRDSLLVDYVKENDFFVRYVKLNNKAYRNIVIMGYVGNNTSEDKMYEQFSKHLDKELSDQEKVIPYWGGRLSMWYERYYLDYLKLEKYGDQLNEITEKEGGYKLDAETIAENYQSPIKESLLTQLLEVYAIMYPPEGSKFITPKDLLLKYKNDIPEKAFNKQLTTLEGKEKKEEKLKQGQPMPAFTFKNTEGEPVEYLASSSDKMTLIDVWASWCGPCIGSFPKMNKIAEKHKDQLRVISISLDDEFEDYKKGLANNDVPGEEKMHAPKAFQSDFADFFMINAIPRYILVDADGNFLNSNLSDLSKIDEYLK